MFSFSDGSSCRSSSHVLHVSCTTDNNVRIVFEQGLTIAWRRFCNKRQKSVTLMAEEDSSTPFRSKKLYFEGGIKDKWVKTFMDRDSLISPSLE